MKNLERSWGDKYFERIRKRQTFHQSGGVEESAKKSPNVKNPNLEVEDERMLREAEIKEKARKRSRGPYRKSSARAVTKRV